MASRSQFKLIEKDFWAILTEAHGLFAEASRIAKDRHGVSISRQAFHSRATKTEKTRERLQSIRETWFDLAESILHKTLTQDEDLKLAFDTAKFILVKKGRARGWSERLEIDQVNDGEPTALDFLKMNPDQRIELLKSYQDNGKLLANEF